MGKKKNVIVYGIEVISRDGYIEEYKCISNVGCRKVATGYAN